MKHVYIPSLPWEEIKSPTGKFHSFFRNVSLALGGIRNTGTWGGGHPFDVQVRRLPSGASVCPFHLHLAQWELFVVQSGFGSVRTSEGMTSIGPGDVFVHPPGTPHQLTAQVGNSLEVLIITDNPPLDGCHYPDSNKWALRPPGKVFRLTETDYFDGEDAPVSGAPPFSPPPPAPAPAVTPFAQRKRNLEAIPWETWASPRGKFRGAGKEVSLALGAKANTPPGLGGHPFDLELGKLAPGAVGVPFHSHASQWEFFLIVSGHARVRTTEGTRELHAGDAFLQPPHHAHQLANASESEDLLYFLVADNPEVDIWHYPDSGKWGLKPMRKFFRAAELDYWDGEE